MRASLDQVDASRRAVEEAIAAFGHIDVLVNNAGYTLTKDFLQVSEEDYNSVFDLNMRGYFFCAQQAAGHMRERGEGSIINITSIHSFAGFPGHAVYAATKGAINAFTRELAIELAEGWS